MAIFNRDRSFVLMGCTIGNAVSKTPAVHSVFGVFLVPLSQEFGWTRASISMVLGIIALTGMVIYPLAGRFADQHGARRMLVAGLLIYGLAVTALSLTTASLMQFYLTFAVVALGGCIASTPIFSKVIADWYDQGRGTALGISAGLGNGIGAVVFPVMAAIVTAQYGWRMGYTAVGALILVLGLPALLFLLRDAPRTAQPAIATGVEDSSDGLSLQQAWRLPRFWLIMLAIASGAGCTTAIFSHVVPIMLDRGYSVELGTAVLSTFALTTSAWQVATGRLLDWIQTPRVVIPMVCMAILGLALLQFGDGAAMMIVAGICLGIGMGSQYGALPYFVARYFGTRAFGAIIGVMYSGVIAAQGVTPVLLDHGFDVYGNYRLAVIMAGMALATGAILLLFLPGYTMASSNSENQQPAPA